MTFIDRFNSTYIIKTQTKKEVIIETYQSRIINPLGNPNLYAYEQIDYSGIILDTDTLICRREGVFDRPGRGKGTISMTLTDSNHLSTIINAEIKPKILGPIFWAYVGMMTLATLIVLLFKPLITILPLIIGWFMLYGLLYYKMVLYRKRLTSYLIAILLDLGIREKLIKST